MYHDVTPAGEATASGFVSPGADRYKLTDARFMSHLEALRQAGVTPGGSPNGRATAVLTFDDGGRSALTTIAPLLAAYCWSAYFFISTAHLGEAGFLDRDDLTALAAAGHIVGSHGHSHRPLTRMRPSEVRDEWRRSKAVLEDALAFPVTAASVPRGAYDHRVGMLAVEEGYADVFTSEPWIEPRRLGNGARVHGRFAVLAATPPETVVAFCTVSRIAIWRYGARWYARKALRGALGGVYERLRDRLLEPAR
jgi:peptidoglycan/xylan/chitin deacetylase (PgdA/CDA1 family)